MDGTDYKKKKKKWLEKIVNSTLGGTWKNIPNE